LELYQYFRRVVGSSCSAQSLAGAGAGGPGGPTAEPGLSKEDAAPIGANGAGAGLSNSTGFVHCDALVFELYQYFRRVEGSSCSAQSLAGLGAATPNGTIGAGVTGLSNSTGLVHCEAFVFELYQYFFLVVGSSCSVQSLAGASGLGAMEPTGANGAGAGLSNSMGFVHCDTFVFELYQYFFFCHWVLLLLPITSRCSWSTGSRGRCWHSRLIQLLWLRPLGLVQLRIVPILLQGRGIGVFCPITGRCGCGCRCRCSGSQWPHQRRRSTRCTWREWAWRKSR